MSEEEKNMIQAFEVLQESGVASETQKQVMLNHILSEQGMEHTSRFDHIMKYFYTCPWRVAFSISIVQGVIFTILFGSQYTNLFLAYFGG